MCSFVVSVLLCVFVVSAQENDRFTGCETRLQMQVVVSFDFI